MPQGRETASQNYAKQFQTLVFEIFQKITLESNESTFYFIYKVNYNNSLLSLSSQCFKKIVYSKRSKLSFSANCLLSFVR